MFKQLRKEADAVQQRDAALCSLAGVGLLGRGALRRGLLEGLPEFPLVRRPCAQLLAPPVGRLLPRVVCWKRAPQLGALLKNRGPTNNKMRSQLPAPWLGDEELAPGDFT